MVLVLMSSCPTVQAKSQDETRLRRSRLQSREQGWQVIPMPSMARFATYDSASLQARTTQDEAGCDTPPSGRRRAAGCRAPTCAMNSASWYARLTRRACEAPSCSAAALAAATTCRAPRPALHEKMHGANGLLLARSYRVGLSFGDAEGGVSAASAGGGRAMSAWCAWLRMSARPTRRVSTDACHMGRSCSMPGVRRASGAQVAGASRFTTSVCSRTRRRCAMLVAASRICASTASRRG